MPAGGHKEAAPRAGAGRICMKAGPSGWVSVMLAKQGKLFFEELSGGTITQNFAVHTVHTAGNIVTIFLSYVLHAPALGKEAADEAVIVLIGATLTGGIGVTVVEGRDQGLDSVSVLKLRTVIHCNALKGVFRKTAEDFLEGGDGSGGGLSGGPEDDFKAGLTFGENQEGFFLSTGFAYHAVHFPVPKGRAAIYDQGAALYAGAFRGPGSLDFSILALFPLGFLPEVLIGDIGNIALVYVAVKRRRGNGPFFAGPHGTDDYVRGFPGVDTGRYNL